MQDEAATLGIAHVVRFLGQRSDVLSILGEVDLLVSASLWEGFPTVLLEAMAAGVPVVATNVSGSRELVRNGETGILVTAGSSEELAHAVLQQLRNRPLALRMAETARQQIQHYSLEQISQKYEQLYLSLLAE
jgi:glycosyltransferase involved in cell wall biosynthesis